MSLVYLGTVGIRCVTSELSLVLHDCVYMISRTSFTGPNFIVRGDTENAEGGCKDEMK